MAEEARPLVEQAMQASKQVLPAWEQLSEDAMPVPPVTPPRAIAVCRQRAREWWAHVCASQPGATVAPGPPEAAPSGAAAKGAAAQGAAEDESADPFSGASTARWVDELKARHGAAAGHGQTVPVPAELELAAVQAASRWAAASARQRQQCSRWGAAILKLSQSTQSESRRNKAVLVAFWRALGSLRRCPEVWAARAAWQRASSGDAALAAGQTTPGWAAYLEEGARACWRDSDLLVMTASDALERCKAADKARALVEWRVKQGTASAGQGSWMPLREPEAPASDLLRCHWIRLARRTQGADAAKRVFADARRGTNVGPGVYLAAAMVETRSNGDKDMALQVLDLGRRYHPKDPNLACAAVDILIEKGDARNARAILQAALAQVDQQCAPSLWERWMDLELRGSQGGGSLDTAEQVEWKRALAMPGSYSMPPFAGTAASLDELVQQAETERTQGAPGMLPILTDPKEAAGKTDGAADAALGALVSDQEGAPQRSGGVPALLQHLHRHQHAGMLPSTTADEESMACTLPGIGDVSGSGQSASSAAAPKPLAWSVEAADGSRDYSGIGSSTVPLSLRAAEADAIAGLNPAILNELPMAAVCHAGVSAGDAPIVSELAEQGPAALLGAGIRPSSQVAPVASIAGEAAAGSASAQELEYSQERKKMAAEFVRTKSLVAAPAHVPAEVAEAVPQQVRSDVLCSCPYLLRLVSILDVKPVGEDVTEQVELCLAGLETAAQSSAGAPNRPLGLP